ncbi:MAG: hypothetical protein K8R68_11430 [Bacteroidales bacterium]|nr:hypothetical protein [Bacteroidales bacterium]
MNLISFVYNCHECTNVFLIVAEKSGQAMLVCVSIVIGITYHGCFIIIKEFHLQRFDGFYFCGNFINPTVVFKGRIVRNNILTSLLALKDKETHD